MSDEYASDNVNRKRFFCGKLIHFYKERISFLFYCEDGKRGAVRLLSLNAVCGSQADLSFT